MTKLKPCPFCGGGAYKCLHQEIHSKKIRHVVKCTRCNAMMEYRSEESAIAAWNRRVNDERTD